MKRNTMDNQMEQRVCLRRYFHVALTVCMLFALAMTCVYATAGDDIVGGVTEGISGFYNLLKSVAKPLAVLAVVGGGLSMLIGGQKAMEAGKWTIIVTVVALAVIFLAPLLVKTIASWFSGTDSLVGYFD